MNNHQMERVNFHGNQLIMAEVDGKAFTALKPISDGMGLDWKSQHRKVTSNKRYGHMTIPIQTVSGVQDMICIPLRKLNGWLASINPARVKPEYREQVELYQEESFEALYKYWNEGGAINPRVSDEQLKTLIGTVQQQAIQIADQNRKINKLEIAFEMISPTVPYGTPSKTTGLPRDDLVESYWKSNSRRKKYTTQEAIQLFLPLFEALAS